jgi:uncharacterized membrane protein
MLAGIVFLVDEILNLMNPAPYLDIMFIVAMLLVVAGLVGFHTLQIGSYGRIGQAAFYTVVVSSLSQLLGLVLLLSGSTALLWLVSVGTLACWWDSCSTAPLPCKRRCCRAGAVLRSS